MTWIKICGITNLEDALVAVESGADALGFVFYEKSPRKVDQETAREIIARMPSSVEKVGVFVNEIEDSICARARYSGLTAAQLHGNGEDPRVADLIKKRRPDLKIFAGISMRSKVPSGWATLGEPASIEAFLLDSSDTTQYGGTGRIFDWEASRAAAREIACVGKVVVAGGLNPTNVGEMMSILHPWGVDVASGVEARPGKKDPEKVRAFIAAVRATDGNS